MVLSCLGGLSAMFVGGLVMGMIYHDVHKVLSGRLEEMTAFSEQTLDKIKLDMNDLSVKEKQKRKELCMATVVMAKIISERVACRVAARFSRNFPTQEHRESALKEAGEIVVEEMDAYTNTLKNHMTEKEEKKSVAE